MENAKRILEDLTLDADLEKKCEQMEEASRISQSRSTPVKISSVLACNSCFVRDGAQQRVVKNERVYPS